MPELPTPGKDDNRPLDLGDFTHGAQSVKAACGCIAFVVLLAIIAFATRELLFR